MSRISLGTGAGEDWGRKRKNTPLTPCGLGSSTSSGMILVTPFGGGRGTGFGDTLDAVLAAVLAVVRGLAGLPLPAPAVFGPLRSRAPSGASSAALPFSASRTS